MFISESLLKVQNWTPDGLNWKHTHTHTHTHRDTHGRGPGRCVCACVCCGGKCLAMVFDVFSSHTSSCSSSDVDVLRVLPGRRQRNTRPLCDTPRTPAEVCVCTRRLEFTAEAPLQLRCTHMHSSIFWLYRWTLLSYFHLDSENKTKGGAM